MALNFWRNKPKSNLELAKSTKDLTLRLSEEKPNAKVGTAELTTTPFG
jgi:hypothetical protein